MRAIAAIFKDAEWLIHMEMLATADFRESRSSEADRQVLEARASILPLLREAAGLRHIDLLLNVEWTFMRLELDHIAHARKNISSLNAGIRQIEAAFAMLDYVRDPGKYQEIASYYTLSQDLVRHSNLPKDAAHKFFASHRTRLGNMETGPLEASQTALLNARLRNIKLARDIYIELQRQALAAPEVCEPRPEIRESDKPYISERRPRLAA